MYNEKLVTSSILGISRITLLLMRGAYLFKTSLRNFDGRGPFGSKHRCRPLDIQTVQNALGGHGKPLLKSGSAKISTLGKNHRRKIPPLFQQSAAGRLNFQKVRLTGEMRYRCHRRRGALLNAISSFRDEVGNRRFGSDCEKEGLVIGIEYDTVETMGTNWFILALVAFFGGNPPIRTPSN